MPDPRTELAVHIAAGAIMYWFGGTLKAAQAFIDPETLHPLWFELADYVISATRNPNPALPNIPPNVQ